MKLNEKLKKKETQLGSTKVLQAYVHSKCLSHLQNMDTKRKKQFLNMLKYNYVIPADPITNQKHINQ